MDMQFEKVQDQSLFFPGITVHVSVSGPAFQLNNSEFRVNQPEQNANALQNTTSPSWTLQPGNCREDILAPVFMSACLVNKVYLKNLDVCRCG